MSAMHCNECKGVCKCYTLVRSKKKIQTEVYESWVEKFKASSSYRWGKRKYQEPNISRARDKFNTNRKEIEVMVENLKSDDAVLCVMFYLRDGNIEFDCGISGNSEGKTRVFDALRKTCKVKDDSNTYCAEENILTSDGDSKYYLFSIALRKGGVIPPCAKCKTILKYYGIFYLSEDKWTINNGKK